MTKNLSLIGFLLVSIKKPKIQHSDLTEISKISQHMNILKTEQMYATTQSDI